MIFVQLVLWEFLLIAGSQSAIILKLIQPEEPFCPGDNVVLACSLHSMPQEMSLPPTLYWRQMDFQPVYYYNGPPLSRSFGDFNSTAHFSNNYYTIDSNATLYNVMLSHNGIVISCYTPSSVPMTFVFKVIGAENPPSTIDLSTSKNMSVLLTWLPPLNDRNCSFNYTVNITNSSSVTEQMYSNSTSLILTDLTHGENYSFAVAVTDSTGQHGPWSEELRVTLDVITPSPAVTTPSVFLGSTLLSTAATPNVGREEFEDRFFYFTVLVIGMGITGGFLILCITSLLVTTFCTIWYFKRKSKTKKHDECVHEQEEKEDTQTATSTPFYDVPVFTEYWEVDSATKSVCDHENNKGSEVSAAMPLYDVAVIKNYWDVNNTVLQNQVQPDELFVHQNTAYM